MVSRLPEFLHVAGQSLDQVFRRPWKVVLDVGWKVGFLLLVALLEIQAVGWLLQNIRVPDAALGSSLNLLIWLRLFWNAEKGTLVALWVLALVLPVLAWFPVEAFFRSGLAGSEGFWKNVRRGFVRFLLSRSTRAMALLFVILVLATVLAGGRTAVPQGLYIVLTLVGLAAFVLTLSEAMVRSRGLTEFGRKPEVLLPALTTLTLLEWGISLSGWIAAGFALEHFAESPLLALLFVSFVVLFEVFSQSALVLSRYGAAGIIRGHDGFI